MCFIVQSGLLPFIQPLISLFNPSQCNTHDFIQTFDGHQQQWACRQSIVGFPVNKCCTFYHILYLHLGHLGMLDLQPMCKLARIMLSHVGKHNSRFVQAVGTYYQVNFLTSFFLLGVFVQSMKYAVNKILFRNLIKIRASFLSFFLPCILHWVFCLLAQELRYE